MQGNKHPKCKPIHIPIRTVVKNMTAVLTVFRCFLFKSKTFSANNYGIIVNNYFLSVNRFCTFGRNSSTFGKLYSKSQFFFYVFIYIVWKTAAGVTGFTVLTAAVISYNRGMTFWYHKLFHYSFWATINNTN